MRIGVFICECGENIGGNIHVERVRESISEYPGVSYSVCYKYMCSDPGQEIIRKSIKEEGLDGVVVAACSPLMHEITFRRAVESGGLNPYLCEIANIREQCAWVHRDREKATEKAVEIIKSIVEKVKRNQPLSPIEIPITKRVLVIGGGISGIQASLDVANSGYDVFLVEKNPSIGGHMAQLSETFPTLDCSACILTPKMVEVSTHPRINLITYAEVEEVEGCIGNFSVRIRKKARYVNEEKCTGCGKCADACVLKEKIENEFDVGMSRRSAIYIPFPQAIPLKYTVDPERCILIQKGKCGRCVDVCDANAIDFSQEDTFVEEKFGCIVIATGFDLYPDGIEEYGYGKYKDVIDGLQFERMLSASGPTGG
ncbi:MAG: FAD-dependent oxidoreductase, partial [Candidatus Syntropharchaeia archaeon]